MTEQPLDPLTTALGVTDAVIAGVRPDQWMLATACPEWDVRQLVDHLVHGNWMFARALGETAAVRTGNSDDPLGDFRRSARALQAAFGSPGALDRIVTVPFGRVPGGVALHLRVTELLVHGWDIARATHQPIAVPEDLAQQELAFAQARLPEVPAGRRPFGPPQPVPADAPAIDRLAACLGRPVTAESG